MASKDFSLPRWNYRSVDSSPHSGWKAWQEVENLVPEAPSSKLIVKWPNNGKIEPNAFTSVGLMTERPNLQWKTEPGALYTVMVLDAEAFPKPSVYLSPSQAGQGRLSVANWHRRRNEPRDYL